MRAIEEAFPVAQALQAAAGLAQRPRLEEEAMVARVPGHRLHDR